MAVYLYINGANYEIKGAKDSDLARVTKQIAKNIKNGEVIPVATSSKKDDYEFLSFTEATGVSVYIGEPGQPSQELGLKDIGITSPTVPTKIR